MASGDCRKKYGTNPLIKRILVGAESVVQTPRMGASETNETRMASFSTSMDPFFTGRNAAVLQHA